MIKILIIEDNFEIRENTCEILEMEGYQVDTAVDGISGLAAAREKRPDLILCDIMMPGLNGYEVLLELKKETSTAGIPFIFVTADAEKKSRKQGLEKGASGYLNKPFETEELLSEVVHCLNL